MCPVKLQSSHAGCVLRYDKTWSALQLNMHAFRYSALTRTTAVTQSSNALADLSWSDIGVVGKSSTRGLSPAQYKPLVEAPLHNT